MLYDAFDLISYAFDGVIYFFMRLYNSLDLSLVFVPLLLIAVSYSLILRPIIGFFNVTRNESIRNMKNRRAAQQKQKEGAG